MADWRLILGDCLDVMHGMEASSVDAVVTDPPYNVGLQYGSTDDHRPDYAAWCLSWMAELRRVCAGPIAVTVGQTNLSMWARLSPPDWWLAWFKPAAMGRCVVGFNNWEPIALYGKPVRRGCDVVRAGITPEPSCARHPCPKPLGWAKRQVLMLSEPGSLVLDPFAGLATTGVACLQTGRRFIGIEIDPGYHASAVECLSGAQGPLFTTPVPEGTA